MIDLKVLRENEAQLRQWLGQRNFKGDLDQLIALDERRRTLLSEVEEVNAKRNAGAKEVGKAKSQGLDVAELMEQMRLLGERSKELDQLMTENDEKIREFQLTLPNHFHASVPVGADENDNVEVRRWGEPRTFDFAPRPHWEVAEKLGVLDCERAVKLAGSRFVSLCGYGAALERALANYMLDLHVFRQGYTEMSVPVLVTREVMTGTGQLPKFCDDLYCLEKDDLWLIPTAEVPLTNFFAGETLTQADLPKKLTARTPCFRRESGSYGRDVRGMMRVHQFDKVEMVHLTCPEDSYDHLEQMTRDAEAVLQGLELPYRVITLCSGDMGFSAAKTYDIEVWLPSEGKYREISSCSNCEDFQARRMNLRYRPAEGGKPRFVHTLNGSGVAVGRAVLAVLENYQQDDGSVIIPKVLRPYMDGVEKITLK